MCVYVYGDVRLYITENLAWSIVGRVFGECHGMPIYPLQRVFYPQNRPCTPKIVGTFYMQRYKAKEKNSNCTPLYPQFQNSVGTLVPRSMHAEDIFCRFRKRVGTLQPLQKTKFLVHIQLSIPL